MSSPSLTSPLQAPQSPSLLEDVLVEASSTGVTGTSKAPTQAASGQGYTAADIEVLEGLEPVRRRPGMYIGGTDARAYHHLFAEILDNAIDEVIAGHAKRVDVHLNEAGEISVSDDGRGIPVDPHPRFPDKSALEVIMTTLHAGGKFGGKAYEASGGLHGVGASVVNALSSQMVVEVSRGGKLYRQTFSRGFAQGGLVVEEGRQRARGTTVRFVPDDQIFGPQQRFDPARLYRMMEAKAYLCAGLEIRWSCSPSLVDGTTIPASTRLTFPGGLQDKLSHLVGERGTVIDAPLCGKSGVIGQHGSLEWALTWAADRDGGLLSFCNTIPTPEGGTHEMALRMALLRALRGHAERVNHKRFASVTTEDMLRSCVGVLSVYIREPEFQGQTKEKLASQEAHKLVEPVIKDACEHALAASPQTAMALMDHLCDIAEDRLRARQEKDALRKTTSKKTRLPGKLADCTLRGPDDCELFIVEGDSAGGSAKQARDRRTQAVLPLRGKILNVVNAAEAKFRDNQQLQDLALAIGTGTGKHFKLSDVRYEKIIIMTDADVDGAHIAALLLTFFWQEMPALVREGYVYLAVPPLYRLTHGSTTVYAGSEAERDRLLTTRFKGKNVEVGRFKGLGEMMPAQLRETTMAVDKRLLLKVCITDDHQLANTVQQLMGSKAEGRFRFLQERAAFVDVLDV